MLGFCSYTQQVPDNLGKYIISTQTEDLILKEFYIDSELSQFL